MAKAGPVSPLLFTIAMVASLCGCATSSPNASTSAGSEGTASASAAPVATKPTLGAEIAAVADNKVVVNFPLGGAALTPGANQQLDLAARLFRDANPVLMFTTGYADPTGDEFSNLVLSARRAQEVKRGLVARGIPAERLLIQALGESELANAANPTAPENRRVVITWRLL